MRWRKSPHIREWIPRLQAHRGYWVSGLQQNSLESIKKAAELCYEMTEFDVRLTKDQKVILFHDEKIQDQKISELNLEEIRNIARPLQLIISELEEVFIWYKSKRAQISIFNFKLNIEIKSKLIFDSQLEKEVFRLVCNYQMQKNILISSFNPLSLYRFKLFDDSIVRALLLTEDSESNYVLKKMFFNILCCPDLLHLRFSDFTQVRYLKLNKQIPVVLWTVNNLEFLNKFRNQIHGVISDSITPDQFEQEN